MLANSAENPGEGLTVKEAKKTTRKYKEFNVATLQRIRALAKSKGSFANLYPEKRATRCLNPGAEEMTLNEVSKASSLYFEWICENNPDHLFPSSVSNRREYSCPTCNNMRRSARLRKIKTDPNNLLIDKFPAHFAQLIHARDTNGDLIARETLAAKSSAIGWWDTGCKHGPFSAKIGERIREASDRGCRKCGNESAANKGRLAAVEKNGSLKKNMPQLAAEWLYPIDDHEGSGVYRDPEVVKLEELLGKLNDLFPEITDTDRINLFNNAKSKMLDNEELRKQAMANSEDQFSQSPKFEEEMLDNLISSMDSHRAMTTKLLNDDRLRARFKDLLAKSVFNEINGSRI